MKIVTPENAPIVSANLNGRIIYAGEENQIIHLSLEPNEEIPLHKNNVQVTFYVLEGSAKLTLGSKSYQLERDNSITIPANADRALKNTGPTIFRQLVIKNMK